MDRISSKVLKDGAEVLALPLCNLINLPIKQSLFPDQCKIAKLKPLFKKGSKSDPKNYTLLPVVFTMIKKTIYIQTEHRLDKNGSFYKYQSGFRMNFSMDSSLAQITDFILREMDDEFHTGIILVDLQKAPDMLDDTILLQKIERAGFKESVIKWFQSYLSYRKYFVTLENVFSHAGIINCVHKDLS